MNGLFYITTQCNYTLHAKLEVNFTSYDTTVLGHVKLEMDNLLIALKSVQPPNTSYYVLKNRETLRCGNAGGSHFGIE